ncbi:serine protease [Mycobacterium sp. M1]|uniref:Serine protease n=1 Tax=Mycolicibacter acidiphilus TaxID=2835306 RepID=A0ABS5RNJ7_9MYCO|nr:serine protease [Mycolicibacter acidiphilus]MBS9535118.1 serine protease [Mycolicibacter acidiphilus]
MSAPSAAAAVLLGGGAAIHVGDVACTLTTIGHDSTGTLVGITSAHCGGLDSVVTVPGLTETVGRVARVNDTLDYAVITFDPGKITPIGDFDGLAISGIGPPPPLRAPACMQSGATGRTCFLIGGRGLMPDDWIVTAIECGTPDDTGAPVTVDDRLIGMVQGGLEPHNPFGRPCPDFVLGQPPIFPLGYRPKIVLMSVILNAIDADGGPGTGYVPVGG